MANIPIDLPTSHGFVRNSINSMMEETFHQRDAGRAIFCDAAYVPPVGTEANGSPSSPFNNLIDAFAAVQSPGTGGAIILGHGIYSSAGAELGRLVSLINPYSRGNVRIDNSLSQTGVNSTFRGINFGGGSTFFVIGDGQGSEAEMPIFQECDLSRNVNFQGGSTGNDVFAYNSVVFSGPWDFDLGGSSHFLTDCLVQDNVNFIKFGRISSSNQPSTFFRIFNCIFVGQTWIQAEAGKTTTVQILATQFDLPIIFNIGAGSSVNLILDLSTYESALNTGTDFEIPDVNLVVLGRSKYQFSDVVIPAGGVIPESPNQPPLPEDYIPVCTLTVPVVDGEIYTVTVNFIKVLADLNDGMYWRFTGDFPSEVFFQESGDAEERIPFAYSFPITTSGTTFTLTFEAATENGAITEAKVTDANISIERKF